MSWMKRPRRGRRARRQEKRLSRVKAAQKKALGFRRVVFNRYGEWMPHWLCERNARLWNQPNDIPVAFKPSTWKTAPEDEWNACLRDMHVKRQLDDVKMPEAYWANDRRGRRKKIPLKKITQEWVDKNVVASNIFPIVRSNSMPNLMDANSDTDCEALPFANASCDNESGYWSEAALLNFREIVCRSYLYIDRIGPTNDRYELNDYYEGRFQLDSTADDTQIWQELDDVEYKVRTALAMDFRLW